MTAFDRGRWRRLQPILDRALDLPAAERAAWLDEACAGDPELRADVEAMLKADADASGAPGKRTGAVLESFLQHLGAEDAGRTRTDVAGEAIESPTDRGRFLPGTILVRRYRIVSLLGRGGMGEVYRADDLKLGQAVALKFVPQRLERQPVFLRRLLEEAKLARQVTHPNVCRVHDLGEADGRHFLSMEYVDGEDLASLLQRIGRLPWEKALEVARQLCSGLAAAHEQGILHRDLKPANVMLDGRGRVRITDFGLAVAGEHLDHREVYAGTPAYMAPEQLQGQPATTLTDVYALGLVLYELFTGRRAFPAATPEELRNLHDSAPIRPSEIVEGFDPAVERAILRCLEPDPALRPPAARAVAAALPGGDPLAAAMAAGETPSPELVAAAGPEGALSPAAAMRTLGATLVMLVALVLLSDRASIVGWIPWTRSPDALEENVRRMLERLGYAERPADRSRRLVFSSAYVRYLHATDRSPERWRRFRERGDIGMLFLYRQSRRHLAPRGANGLVTESDPPPAAGDIQVLTDAGGRLGFLEARPEDAEPAASPALPPDWSRLFEAARLDMRGFEPVQPTRNPPMPADARAAWLGVIPDLGLPVRVEAAAHRGRTVFFELIVPFSPYWDPAAPRTRSGPLPPAVLVTGLLVAFAVGVTGVLVVRNWVNGRGDRRGAYRLAAIVFCLRFAAWMLGGHHVPDPAEEWGLLLMGLAQSLVAAAATWAFYLALEPHARRLHPRVLVSWTRLLRGRLRDPLVGRDILYGAALAAPAIALWTQLHVVVPHALGLPPPPPFPFPMGQPPFLHFLTAPPSRTLLGGRHVLEAIPAQALLAFSIALFSAIILLGLRLLFRREWPALAAFIAVYTLTSWPAGGSGFSVLGIAFGLLGTLLMVWALRFGLLGFLALWFCMAVWVNFPVTARLETPHFGIGLVGVLLIAATAAWGAFTASRSRTAAQAAEPRLAA